MLPHALGKNLIDFKRYIISNFPIKQEIKQSSVSIFRLFLLIYGFKPQNIKEILNYIILFMYCQDQPSTFNLKLIFVNEIDGSSRDCIFSVPFIPSTRQLRLNEALDDTCQRIYKLYGTQLFQVDFANKMHIFLGVYPPQREIRISYDSIVNGSVQINFKIPTQRDLNSYEMKQQELNSMNKGTKYKKVKERTIQQALQSVKLWRKLYDTDDGNGKRLYTLDQASKIVGIAKKTLDDYYSLIRTAMNFSFNMQRYKQCKVGLLRKFVKIAKEEGQEGVNSKMAEYLYDMEIEKYWISLSDL